MKDFRCVCNSNYSFFITSILVARYNLLTGIIIYIVACCSTLYHNDLSVFKYRVLDCISAILAAGFILITQFNNIKLSNIIFLGIAFICWISSSIAWKYDYKFIYAILHSLWHIMVALELIKIFYF